MMGETSLEEEITRANVEISGNPICLQSFKDRFRKICHTNATIINSTTPIRENRHLSTDSTPFIKAGWLLKKRDIISGWKARYFEVYRDRLDYFTDQNDTKPRGSIALIAADIGTVKQIKVKRSNDHYSITLETKNPDKTIRLASERTGLEGKVEADSWHQAFTIATASSHAAGGNDGSRASITPRQFANGKGGATEARGNGRGGGAASMIRRVSMSAFAIANGDEPLSFKALLVYAVIILGLLSLLWYAWAMLAILSTKTFVTLLLLVGVLVIIFVQEFLSVKKQDKNNLSVVNKAGGNAKGLFVASPPNSPMGGGDNHFEFSTTNLLSDDQRSTDNSEDDDSDG